MNKLVLFLAAGFCLLLNGCHSATSVAESLDPMMAAYEYVLDHWQPVSSGDARRGYNIAAVLVGPNGKILAKELNSVIALQDCTQHAEMRLVQNYLAEHKCFNLNGCCVYATLEPCAMCAATMSMAGIRKVYYGQSDPEFGKAAERLSLDSSPQNGYKPYPRVLLSELCHSPMQRLLEEGFRKSGMKEITKWLATDDAKKIFLENLPDK